MIVDRGLRDSMRFLQEFGYPIQMPSFLSKTRKEHTTKESSTSRLMTQILWVDKAANGGIKKRLYLNNVARNSQITYIGDILRIVCSMISKY